VLEREKKRSGWRVQWSDEGWCIYGWREAIVMGFLALNLCPFVLIFV
jgi:hypothetical protein